MALEILVVDDKFAEDISADLSDEFGDKVVPYPVSFEDQAIELVEERGYDLVVLDFNLVEKKGREVAKEMLAIRPDLRIAGYSTDWNDSNSKEAGLDTYFRNGMQLNRYIADILEE